MTAVAFHRFLEMLAACFARDFSGARRGFLEDCLRRDASVWSYRHPLTGPDDEELVTDVAYIGSSTARNRLIVVSGTHGVEGLAGSGCQRALLQTFSQEELPHDTGLLLIHMLNPWGAAWRRRQTEGNVDLNRNFLHFESADRPENVAYDRIRDAVMTRGAGGALGEAAQRTIDEFKAEHGSNAYAGALFQGQYWDSIGIGYGGDQPTWSNRTLHSILRDHVPSRSSVGLIDLHTGLGPFGHGTLLTLPTGGNAAIERLRRTFGPGVTVLDGKSGGLPYTLTGDLCSAVSRALPTCEVSTLALEFGTHSVEELLALQVEDCWLQQNGDPLSATGKQVRDRLERFFFPATRDWLESIAFRTLQVTWQFLRELGESF